MTAPAGWHPDPQYPAYRSRWWDGTRWTEHWANGHPPPAYAAAVRVGPAPHGCLYWLTVGLVVGPVTWAGRVGLWLVAWPIGLWRSIRHGQKADARRGR